MEKRKIEIMDTTLMVTNLRVSFSAVEKLTIAQLLLELNVDRIEIASACKGISRSKRDNGRRLSGYKTTSV
jgi:isopropylmalate/homocitrate/citramalate synthase